MNNKTNKALTIVLIISGLLFIFSSSILLPMLSRNFYFFWAKQLNILDDLNVYAAPYLGRNATFADIKDAYNSVMDFIWKGFNFPSNSAKPGHFLTGSLPLSLNGKSHFEDCIFWFWLDFDIFLITGIILITLLVLRILKKFNPITIWGYSPLFLLGLISISVITIICIAICLAPSFADAYIVFHKIIFLGRETWYFDFNEDMFVNMLPIRYVIVVAITIVSLISIQSIAAIIYSVIKKIKTNKKEAPNLN
ncbi:MAG: DUF1461 domain-containing protein [Bacilli bacterium]|nr:DUF1461 domain-containing protein [Bacilli bacterium]